MFLGNSLAHVHGSGVATSLFDGSFARRRNGHRHFGWTVLHVDQIPNCASISISLVRLAMFALHNSLDFLRGGTTRLETLYYSWYLLGNSRWSKRRWKLWIGSVLTLVWNFWALWYQRVSYSVKSAVWTRHSCQGCWPVCQRFYPRTCSHWNSPLSLGASCLNAG